MSRSAPGLLPIFRSDNQLRLLGQLFLHPDREQTIAELESATAIPQQTVSREVDRLVKAGLLDQPGPLQLAEADVDTNVSLRPVVARRMRFH